MWYSNISVEETYIPLINNPTSIANIKAPFYDHRFTTDFIDVTPHVYTIVDLINYK